MRATKDSGVDWLGEIPADWEVSRIGACVTERRQTVSDTDFPALSVTKKGVVPQLDSAAKSDNLDGRKLIRKDDFVINSRSDRKGSSGVSELDGSCSVVYTVLQLKRFLPAFAHHLFRSQPFQEEFYRWGTGIVDDLWSTRYSSMKQIPVPVPDLDEQRRIADFLDHETAKIDALIAKQELLITTLDERRGAVTSRAVTRGLVEDRPLRDSGVEWLGEIPENWQAMPLRWCATLQTGSTPRNGEYTDSDECPWFRPDDLDETGAPSSATRFYPRAAVAALPLAPANSTLVGAIGTIGKVGYLTENAYFNQQITAVTPRFDSRFAFYVLKAAQGVLEALSVGNTLQILNNYRLGSLITPIPPRPEQRAIAEYLDSEVGSINRIKRQAKRLSELLVERRQALISAAVTGKLEVNV